MTTWPSPATRESCSHEYTLFCAERPRLKHRPRACRPPPIRFGRCSLDVTSRLLTHDGEVAAHLTAAGVRRAVLRVSRPGQSAVARAIGTPRARPRSGPQRSHHRHAGRAATQAGRGRTRAASIPAHGVGRGLFLRADAGGAGLLRAPAESALPDQVGPTGGAESRGASPTQVRANRAAGRGVGRCICCAVSRRGSEPRGPSGDSSVGGDARRGARSAIRRPLCIRARVRRPRGPGDQALARTLIWRTFADVLEEKLGPGATLTIRADEDGAIVQARLPASGLAGPAGTLICPRTACEQECWRCSSRLSWRCWSGVCSSRGRSGPLRKLAAIADQLAAGVPLNGEPTRDEPRQTRWWRGELLHVNRSGVPGAVAQRSPSRARGLSTPVRLIARSRAGARSRTGRRVPRHAVHRSASACALRWSCTGKAPRRASSTRSSAN